MFHIAFSIFSFKILKLIDCLYTDPLWYEMNMIMALHTPGRVINKNEVIKSFVIAVPLSTRPPNKHERTYYDHFTVQSFSVLAIEKRPLEMLDWNLQRL